MRPDQTLKPLMAAGLVLLAAGAGCGSSGDSSSTAPANGGAAPPGTAGSAAELAPVSGPYHPAIDPADFVRTIDNPYFPLEPGTGFHYAGVAEDGTTRQRDDMFVTGRTKSIMGVTCTVVRDVVSAHGGAIEKTFDWYAQDVTGNVWYMGEDTRELEHGRFVKQDDSWQAGVDGAQPGIIMPADPAPGDAYRQEYYPGHALDQARVIGHGGPLRVPAGSYAKTLLTTETAPKLDPGVAEHKYYVAGVGDVKEKTVRGNHEQIRLIRITH